MTSSQADAIALRFELGRVVRWERLGGTRNCNFLLHTSTGPWFVRRRHPAYCGDGWIRFDHELARYLSERGVAVEPPRASDRGDAVLRDGNDIWQVHAFVTGEQLREGHPEDLQALAEGLAQFHRAAQGFNRHARKLGPRGETDPVELRAQCHELEAGSPECAQALKPLREWLAAAEITFPERVFTALPATVVHGDVQPANVLVRGGRVAAFVDLDWCAWRPRIYDLAFAILFCCATHETPIQGGDVWSLTQPPRVDADVVRSFVGAYERHTQPLIPQEREVLPSQLVLSWCHCRIGGAFKVSAGERTAFLSRAPHTLDELLPGRV